MVRIECKGANQCGCDTCGRVAVVKISIGPNMIFQCETCMEQLTVGLELARNMKMTDDFLYTSEETDD